jgi:hypothetical protein
MQRNDLGSAHESLENHETFTITAGKPDLNGFLTGFLRQNVITGFYCGIVSSIRIDQRMSEKDAMPPRHRLRSLCSELRPFAFPAVFHLTRNDGLMPRGTRVSVRPFARVGGVGP